MSAGAFESGQMHSFTASISDCLSHSCTQMQSEFASELLPMFLQQVDSFVKDPRNSFPGKNAEQIDDLVSNYTSMA